MRRAGRRWLGCLAVVLMNTLTELEAERVRFREHQEAWRVNNHAQAVEIERLKKELEQHKQSPELAARVICTQ